MPIQDSGWYVRIKYTVRIVDGPVLKGLNEPEILDFVTGYRQVIPGLENRLDRTFDRRDIVLYSACGRGFWTETSRAGI